MSIVIDAPARTARRGFDSLDNETHVESLPWFGARAPAVAPGVAAAQSPGAVGRRRPLGQPLVRRAGDAPPLLVGDGQVLYANRFLQSKAYRAAKERGRIAYSEFATDPCRSLFARVTAMFSPKLTDNANVNLVKLGERFISMTEHHRSSSTVVPSRPRGSLTSRRGCLRPRIPTSIGPRGEC